MFNCGFLDVFMFLFQGDEVRFVFLFNGQMLFYICDYCKWLCEWFMVVGGDVLLDYELLELLLFCVILCQDVKFLVWWLFEVFGFYNGVLFVLVVCLGEVKGVGVMVICELKLVEVVVYCLVCFKVMQWCIFSSWDVLLDYCQMIMVY